jgi:hypothetical protein
VTGVAILIGTVILATANRGREAPAPAPPLQPAITDTPVPTPEPALEPVPSLPPQLYPGADDHIEAAPKLERFSDDMFPAVRYGKYGVVRNNGSIVIDFMYSTLNSDSDGYMQFSNGLWKVRSGDFGYQGLYGYVDANNKVIIPIMYVDATDFYEGICGVLTDDGGWGFYNDDGKWLIMPKYEAIGRFSDGVCPVKYNGYWGVIDTSGNVVVDFLYGEIRDNTVGGLGARTEFSETRRFHNGVSIVSLNNALGVINTSGQFVVPLAGNHRDIDLFDDLIYVYSVSNGEHSAKLYDLSGNILLDNLTYSEEVPTQSRSERSGTRTIYVGTRIAGVLGNQYVMVKTWDGRQAFSFYNFTDNSVTDIVNDLEFYGDWGIGFINIGDREYMLLNNHQGRSIYVNEQGEVVLDTSDISRSFIGNTYFVTYSKGNERWNIYNSEMAWVHSILSQGSRVRDIRYFSGGFITDKDDLFFAPQAIFDCATGEVQHFGSVSLGTDRSTLWHSYGSAAIVQDEAGIFYGLWAYDRLAFDLEYTKIIYNSDGDYFTLERGAESIKVRVARNGNIEYL